MNLAPSADKRTTPYNSQARTIIHQFTVFQARSDNKGPLLDVKKYLIECLQHVTFHNKLCPELSYSWDVANPNNVTIEEHQHFNHGTSWESNKLAVCDPDCLQNVPQLWTPRRKKPLQRLMIFKKPHLQFCFGLP